MYFIFFTDYEYKFDVSYEETGELSGSGAEWEADEICSADFRFAFGSGDAVKKKNYVHRACNKYGDFLADSPKDLVVSALQFIKTAVPQIDFVLLTGDLVPHNLWETTKENVFAALDQAVGLIKANLPGVVVYPSIGNHDTSPTNYFAPTNFATYLTTSKYGPRFTATKDLYDHFGNLFTSWLPVDAVNTFKKTGNYIVRPWTGFKIISFNTNYCYGLDLYNYLLVGNTDPDFVLSWLVSELAASETSGEKVWIIGHIPPGLIDCVEDFSHLFYQIVDRYSPAVLTGLFYGHAHTDQFQVFYSLGTETAPSAVNAINTAYLSPSLTPYTNGNPALRIYKIDPDTMQVLDSVTYIANLNNATRWNVSGPVWELEYTAKSAYVNAVAKSGNSGWLSPSFWHWVSVDVENDAKVFDTYRRFSMKSSGLEGECSGSCKGSLVCGLRAGKSELNC
ncbi:hypothetical protein HDU76_006143 [Blyttiomyces sp. JEL0837]|nr:hypothetical protein HDU76_006143 [Blyttiomyces sp. JEL0837]